ncbi:hypothetical protein PR048_000322 [Dryococelus australis]|uniref:Uncharacterized protein n=1 Tax=Dryococelus australis TaxID=614101 RepID=A0ABQ9IGK7_9NEOP|nr:hypothetical protein PR048_000322 [Dryococelus australis]
MKATKSEHYPFRYFRFRELKTNMKENRIEYREWPGLIQNWNRGRRTNIVHECTVKKIELGIGIIREFNDLQARLRSSVYTRASVVCSLVASPVSSQCFPAPGSMALAACLLYSLLLAQSRPRTAQQAPGVVHFGRRHMEKDDFRYSTLPSYRLRTVQPGLIPWLVEAISAYRSFAIWAPIVATAVLTDGVRFPAGSLPHGEIVPNDAVGRRVFSGVSSFSLPCIPVLLHSRLASPLFALETSVLGAAQNVSTAGALAVFNTKPGPHRPHETAGAVVVQWLDYSPPTKANLVRFLPGSLPDSCAWESCRTMALFSGICRFLRSCISALLHTQLTPPCSALKTTDVVSVPATVYSRIQSRNISQIFRELQKYVGTPIANQRLVTYSPVGSSANSDHFAALSRNLGVRTNQTQGQLPEPLATNHRTGMPTSKEPPRLFRFCARVYSVVPAVRCTTVRPKIWTNTLMTNTGQLEGFLRENPEVLSPPAIRQQHLRLILHFNASKKSQYQHCGYEVIRTHGAAAVTTELNNPHPFAQRRWTLPTRPTRFVLLHINFLIWRRLRSLKAILT